MPKRRARAEQLRSKAEQQYPFVRWYDPVVVESPDTRNKWGGMLETWHPGDEGAPDLPRPSGIPMERTGVELYQSQQASPLALAAEMLHVDPYANYTRGALNLSPEQEKALRFASEDFDIPSAGSYLKAYQNALDSAMRGYAMNQWTPSENAEMQYTPQQTSLLDMLQKYTQTGVYPLNFDLSSLNR